ncbi:UNVERIFIED_CONTAM: hypothetical protein Sradi_5853100 [Sesamum radiatum]|uniref:Uncharacterized protein n=1 Tax=Sesamum radiatum TaxID=300843 RepID=A0AAW2KRB1_SESRA
MADSNNKGDNGTFEGNSSLLAAVGLTISPVDPAAVATNTPTPNPTLGTNAPTPAPTLDSKVGPNK